MNPGKVVKQATSYVQNTYQSAKNQVSNTVNNVKTAVVNTTKSVVNSSFVQGAADGFAIWGNGINNAVQKNFGVQGIDSAAAGGLMNGIAQKSVSAVAKGAGGGALAQTAYDAAVNIGKGYYNYFTGSK